MKKGDLLSIDRQVMELVKKSDESETAECWDIRIVTDPDNIFERIWVQKDEIDKLINLNAEDISIMKHALGIEDRDIPYRNFYVANEGCKEISTLRKLVQYGLMDQKSTPPFLSGDAILFVVTQAGKKIIK